MAPGRRGPEGRLHAHAKLVVGGTAVGSMHEAALRAAFSFLHCRSEPPTALPPTTEIKSTVHDHRLPRALHDRAERAAGVPRRADRGAEGSVARAARSGPLKISDDQIRESLQPQLKFQRERGTDVTIFSPRASAMAHHIGDAHDQPALDAALQRSDPPRLRALPGELRRRVPAAADAGRCRWPTASPSSSAASTSSGSSAAT